MAGAAELEAKMAALAALLDLPGRGAWWTIRALLDAQDCPVPHVLAPGAAAALGTTKDAAETILTQLAGVGLLLPTAHGYVAPHVTRLRRHREVTATRVRRFRQGKRTYDRKSLRNAPPHALRNDKLSQPPEQETSYDRKPLRNGESVQPVDQSGRYDDKALRNAEPAPRQASSPDTKGTYDEKALGNALPPHTPLLVNNTPNGRTDPPVGGAGAQAGGGAPQGEVTEDWGMSVMKRFPVLVHQSDRVKNRETLRRLLLMARTRGPDQTTALVAQAIENNARNVMAYAEHVHSVELAKAAVAKASGGKSGGGGRPDGPRQATAAEWQNSPYKR